jgi:hypothetical protein
MAVGEDSTPPAKPSAPEGETNGKVGEEYTYTTSTSDSDGDQVYYLFDWGDGSYSGWEGPYDSGDTGEASYTWTEEGTYEIKVKAKDENGVQGVWSDPLPIEMPVKSMGQYTSLLVELFQRLIQRFPIIEQLLAQRPLLGALLEL